MMAYVIASSIRIYHCCAFASAKVVKIIDLCNSMCLFLRKSSRIGSKKTQAICEECGRGKRHKPYVRSAGGGKDTSQGGDMYKKTQAEIQTIKKKIHAKGNIASIC